MNSLKNKLSIIIPVYNEKDTIDEIVSRVINVQLKDIEEKEIIIIDDGSKDGTTDLLNKYSKESCITVFFPSLMINTDSLPL